MSATVGFGLIGCGAAGKVHARAMAASGKVELRHVADTESRAARHLGERYGVPWTADVGELLANPAVEAVSVAVPHDQHLEVASRAARAGKHVLLEKPFTLRCEQAAELIATCRQAGVVLMPWLERRYQPFVPAARAFVRGTLGRVVYTRVSCLGYKPRAYWTHGMRFEEYPSRWRAERAAAGGGVLIMNAVHQIDLMAHITCLEVEDVFARTDTLHHEVEVEDMAVVNLRYRGGAMGLVEASCCAYGCGEFPIERVADSVMGTDGHVQFGAALKTFDRTRHARTTEFPKVSVADMKTALLDDFASHLRDGTPLRCTPRDAVRTLAVVEAAYQSAATNRPVPLSDASDDA